MRKKQSFSAGLVLNDLALLRFAQGRHIEAETLYRRALALMEASLRPEHRKMASVLENYARLLRVTGRDEMASLIEARVKAIRAEHPKKNFLLG